MRRYGFPRGGVPDTVAPARTLILLALGNLLAGILMAVAGTLGIGGLAWFGAHEALLLFGFLLPAFLAVIVYYVAELGPRVPDGVKVVRIGWILAAGAWLLAVARLAGAADGSALLLPGWLALVAAGGMQTGVMLKALPSRGESVVDVDRDPLTKGDDACFTQLRFAHFFLPLGLLGLALGHAPWLATSAMGAGIRLAGGHALLAGFGLFATYGVSHLVVPRYSGVPAIAAGAIKGELHSGLLGLVGLMAGFLVGANTPVGRGLVVGLGPFLFISFFTFMGVLGANIMRNKSKTQRVTREFVYVPWTFTGVFWLICGVLLGIFLGFAPQALPDFVPELRFVHVHIALLGGMAQLLLGFALRWLPAWTNQQPPLFQASRGAFFLFNGGFTALLIGRLAGSVDAVLWGGVATAAGVVLLLASLRGYFPARDAASA